MLTSILVGFGVGIVSSIIVNAIYEKFFKKQQFGKPAEIVTPHGQASKNSLSDTQLSLEGVFVLV